MSKHHKYGGSTTSRWLVCTASTAAIEEDILAGKIAPGGTSIYADQGTVAHALGEHCLKTGLEPNDFFMQKFHTIKDKRKLEYVMDEDFVDAVTVYTNYIRPKIERAIYTKLEGRFSLKKYLNADAGGSADYLGVIDTTMHVDDYKHGKGVGVEIEGNTQTRFYGLGAYLKLKKYRPKVAKQIQNVQMSIIQPRFKHKDGPIRPETIPLVELVEWGEDIVKPAIHANQTPKLRKFVPGEKQCAWCKRKDYCEPRLEWLGNEAMLDFKDVLEEEFIEPNSLTIQQLLNVLARKKEITDWLNSIYDHLYSRANLGTSIPEHKLVDDYGNRIFKKEMSQRKIMRKILKETKLDKDLFFEEPKMKSVAQIEKVIAHHSSKKDAERIMKLVAEKPHKGTKLVHNNDKRTEVPPSIEADFAEVIEKGNKRKNRKH